MLKKVFERFLSERDRLLSNAQSLSLVDPAGEKYFSRLASATLFNSYTKAYNKRYQQSGTLFEHRFQAKIIRNSAHLLHLCRYIHANPVKDGLVASPSDWLYSNYLEWIGERAGELVDREFIRHQFSDTDEYRSFVSAYLQTRALPEDVQRYLDSIE